MQKFAGDWFPKPVNSHHRRLSLERRPLRTAETGLTLPFRSARRTNLRTARLRRLRRLFEVRQARSIKATTKFCSKDDRRPFPELKRPKCGIHDSGNKFSVGRLMSKEGRPWARSMPQVSYAIARGRDVIYIHEDKTGRNVERRECIAEGPLHELATGDVAKLPNILLNSL